MTWATGATFWRIRCGTPTFAILFNHSTMLVWQIELVGVWNVGSIFLLKTEQDIADEFGVRRAMIDPDLRRRIFQWECGEIHKILRKRSVLPLKT